MVVNVGQHMMINNQFVERKRKGDEEKELSIIRRGFYAVNFFFFSKSSATIIFTTFTTICLYSGL